MNPLIIVASCILLVVAAAQSDPNNMSSDAIISAIEKAKSDLAAIQQQQHALLNLFDDAINAQRSGSGSLDSVQELAKELHDKNKKLWKDSKHVLKQFKQNLNKI